MLLFRRLSHIRSLISPSPTTAITQLLLAADNDEEEEESKEEVSKYTCFLEPSNVKMVQNLMSIFRERRMMKSRANWM